MSVHRESPTFRWQLLLICGGLISVLGLAAELLHGLIDIHSYDRLLFFFSLSYEQNLPTWYSSILLFSAGVLLWLRSRSVASHQWNWRLMSAGLFLASIDETCELHEGLSGLFGTSGLLYFDWIIPASIVMAGLALAFIPFLRTLDAQLRRGFLVAGSVYLGGAILMELPLGYWTDLNGQDNLGYACIDWLEESLEILGASLFLLTLSTQDLEP